MVPRFPPPAVLAQGEPCPPWQVRPLNVRCHPLEEMTLHNRGDGTVAPIIPSLCTTPSQQTGERDSPVGLEEASFHEFYSYKDINFANNCELGMGPFPSDRLPCHPWLAP